MSDILEQILAHKRLALDKQKQMVPLSNLEAMVSDLSAPGYRLSTLLTEDRGLHVIAEFKRKSPSKPQLKLAAEVDQIASAYQQAGASALSVLTDDAFFGGSPADLSEARRCTTLPILRKDFIIDPYQILEARLMGADLVLLIAEALDQKLVAGMTHLAHQVGLEVILEMHDESQLSKIPENIDFIGINNRDLRHFTTDIQCSINMARWLPSSAHWISESGIHTVQQAHLLADAGYRIFLVGEQFMKTDDPGLACSIFVQQINEGKR